MPKGIAGRAHFKARIHQMAGPLKMSVLFGEKARSLAGFAQERALGFAAGLGFPAAWGKGAAGWHVHGRGQFALQFNAGFMGGWIGHWRRG